MEVREGVCRICGCTDDNPCYNPQMGNCWWHDDTHTICSHCADERIASDPETRHCINSEESDIIRVCEHCGEEFVLTPFNEFAPYAMCDSCYDEYLIKEQ